MEKFYYVTLIVMVAMMSCKSDNKNTMVGRGQQGPIVVEAFLVQPRSISEKVEVPGSLLPAEETQIRTEVSGRIVELNIGEGSRVSKGTVLVKLFDGDLRAQLGKLEVQLKIAEKTEERQRELLAINGISQQEYDLTVLSAENLKADIESTKIAIAKTLIRAPYDGLIGLRYVSLGSYVSPADIITNIRQVDQLKLEFSIPEKYATMVAKGSLVQFKVDGGREVHAASVLATESRVDQNTRTLKVRALVNKKHPELVPGVFAKVNLELGQNVEALLIPTQAVVPQARNKQVIVFKRDSAIFKIVETGVRDSTYVQITRGLNPGDTVVITGLMAIRPGSKIKVSKVNSFR